ncbi:MAG: hypothetical protein ACOYEK_01795 [bacterium]|jgi:UDP-GlcNAc:undecaprenyl-phosphate GlcNAc-1-phosphate transferase
MWLCLYSYLLAYLLIPAFFDMLLRGGLVRENYQGKQLPLGMGIVILFVSGLSLITTLPLYWQTWEREGLVFLFLLALIGLLGLLDDVAGRENVKGLKGHLSFFFSEGCISTGLLKGLGGICGSFFVSLLLADSFSAFFQGGILLSLSINTMNLLDLRPGRAIKTFLFIMAMAFIGSGDKEPYFLFGSVIGAVLAYFPFDLKGQVMLGDTGANVLGVVAGLALFWSLAPWQRLLAITFLAVLHVFCERHSLTKVIEGIPVLNFLDRLGRPES